MTCETCGLPDGSLLKPGLRIRLKIFARGKFEREQDVTVWCCTDECAVQAIAIGRYGPATHKWPIALAQFRATDPLKGRIVEGEKPKRIPARKLAKDRVWNGKGGRS